MTLYSQLASYNRSMEHRLYVILQELISKSDLVVMSNLPFCTVRLYRD